MGWQYHKLTYPFTKIAKNGNGDLQQALRTSKMKQSEIFAYGVISKWAKFRAFVANQGYHDRYGDTNSRRLAGLKAANLGFGTLPVYASASEFIAALRNGITPGSHWLYARPTSFLRALDFEGYVDDYVTESQWGELGLDPDYPKWLTLPFNGGLNVTDNLLTAYSQVSAYIDAVDGELHPSGLLYPSDWGGTQLDFPNWYFGIICVKQSIAAGETPDIWSVISANKLSTYGEGSTILSHIPCTQGEQSIGLGQGNFFMFPIICSNRPSNISERFFNYKSNWVSEYSGPGKVVLLDGYRLPVTMSMVADALTFTYAIAAGNPATLSLTVTNDTNAPVTLGSQFFCYVYTYYINRYDEEAIDDADSDWLDNGTEYTGSVKNDDDQIVGRYVDLIVAFRAANGGSSQIAAYGSVSFQVSIGAQYDGKGYAYNNMSGLLLCFSYTTQQTSSGRKSNYLEYTG